MAEYCADLWRAFERVVALFPTVAATGVVMPEFRPADTRNRDYSTVQALNSRGGLVAVTSRPIARIGKVE